MVNTINTNSFIKNTINNNGSSVVVYSNSVDASTAPTVFSSGINRMMIILLSVRDLIYYYQSLKSPH